MLKQTLQQKLLQKLSPQQIMLMKLLQIPSVALEQRIKQEVEENPALDFMGNREEVSHEEHENGESPSEQPEPSDEEFNLSDYLGQDDTPTYKLHINNRSADDKTQAVPFSVGVSFHESLLNQLELRMLSDKEYVIGFYIIGSIDDAGYLERSIDAMVNDLAFTQGIDATEEEVEKVLNEIRSLDPPGVGARDLRECLSLQLDRMKGDDDDIRRAHLLLDKYFLEFSKKHYQKILKRSDFSEEELKRAVDLILSLNPKPGSSFSSDQSSFRGNEYIIPDFIISNEDDRLILTLNSRNAPELNISRTYTEMLEGYSENRDNQSKQQKEAMMFIKQKIDSARWFIDAIKQRQHTLYVTMKAIMDYQEAYFLSGDEGRLKPMILKDIAEVVNLDISTVSRVANSKYVQTPFGTFLLKSFFSESMQTESGETISNRKIKGILKDLIEAEDKSAPLTDDYLSQKLKKEGFAIARRTVAKYREQLSIPVARLRKEL